MRVQIDLGWFLNVDVIKVFHSMLKKLAATK